MYNKTYSYYVNPAKRLFCSDDAGTPISDLPRFYFGERPVFTMTFEDGVLVEGEKLVFVMDNENRFLDSRSTTGLAPVMAWCVHEITAEDVQSKSIDLELYCFGRKYADVINGHDNAVTCILSLFIKSIDENLNCTFSTLATTLAYAEPTIVSPDCVFDELPIDMYLTRDEMNALIAEVEAIQREAIEKAEQARQSAAVAEAAAQEASQIAKDLKPLQLSSPPTTSTVGSIGQLAVYHDATTGKDHLYHLCYITEGESATLYHWEECVLVSMGNVAGGYAALDENGLVPSSKLPWATAENGGVVRTGTNVGTVIIGGERVAIYAALTNNIDAKSSNYLPIVPSNLDYAVRSVCKNITEIPAATSDYSLVDSSATTNNHSHVYSHSPSTAPTYRLPQVTNTTIAHYIELTVDFTAVQTYSFLDYQGEPIVPLFTPSIAAGDVYTFKMEYSAIKGAWLIYPQKQGAVADDFVMRGEVGAANGVAGLDSNAVVPINNLPIAATGTFGLVKPTNGTGTGVSGDKLVIIQANNGHIDARVEQYRPITPYRLNYAVTAAITDSNHITLNDAQKATAQSVFGVGGPITAIPAATSAYTLAEGVFTHAPTNAPTYTLPNITDDIRTHEVVLIIDFSSVQTFSFLVDGGGEVTFQSYANPTMGDVWAFRCWWYGGKWRIAPTKIKNCVTRQLANGSLAITDAVAGDALVLRMTAPRSVVVNQLIDWDNAAITRRLNDTYATLALDRAGRTATLTIVTATDNNGFVFPVNLVKDHIYIFHGIVTCNTNTSYTQLGSTNIFTNPPHFSVSANTDTPFTTKSAVIRNAAEIEIYPSKRGEVPSGKTFAIADFEIVDLTQYFNGDSALIDSITSWDDLVAYDPRFASYVEYNAGTVAGVQPGVKFSGKNLINQSLWQDITGQDGNTHKGYNQIDVRGGQSIHVKFNPTGTIVSYLYMYVKDASGKVLTNADFINLTGLTSCYITTNRLERSDFTVSFPTGFVGKFTIYLATGIKTLEEVNTYLNSLQVELGSSATAYEPYHNGGTAQASKELFTVGSVADEFEAVSGKMVESLSQLDLSTLQWTAGEGSYSATVEDIKSSTQNILLPNGYVGSVSGTTLTITASATPTGIMVYEKATQTTTLETPVEITLLGGANAIMQTDGGRLAPIDITYESDEL